MTSGARPSESKVVIRPVTPDRWGDVVALFGPRGVCAGCWCMYFRQSRSEFERKSGAGNRRALRRLIAGGTEPGLLAYVDGVPAGWMALAPREEYTLLSRSRILQPVDDKPVWSVVCFFVARAHRGRGLTVALLRKAAAYARRRGRGGSKATRLTRSRERCRIRSPTTGWRRPFVRRAFVRWRAAQRRARS